MKFGPSKGDLIAYIAYIVLYVIMVSTHAKQTVLNPLIIT